MRSETKITIRTEKGQTNKNKYRKAYQHVKTKRIDFISTFC